MKKLEEFVQQELEKVNKARQDAQRQGNPAHQQTYAGKAQAYIEVILEIRRRQEARTKRKGDVKK